MSDTMAAVTKGEKYLVQLSTEFRFKTSQ